MAQTSTTGSLENASREMIAAARFTEEHNAPCMELIEKFTLEKGADTFIVPKISQMNISALTEGQDMIDEEDIGMSTISVQPSEIGAKIIITDRLLRQNSQDIWRLVGRQMGDAMARKKDEDVISLFSALNEGTTFGASGAAFSLANVASAIGIAKADKYGSDLRIVHHPSAVLQLNKDITGVYTTQRPIPAGMSAERLDKFWTGLRIGGVPIFEDGNITKGAASVGAIFDQGALGILQSVSMNQERERDASLRATELVVTADYGVFEIDDSRGAPMTYTSADPSTSA
jgi:hypothetical protein